MLILGLGTGNILACWKMTDLYCISLHFSNDINANRMRRLTDTSTTKEYIDICEKKYERKGKT